MKKLMTICLLAVMFVFCSSIQAATWNVPIDFATIQDAIDSPLVIDGDTIIVGPGQHAGAEVTKAVEIRGEGGAVISSGPLLTTYMPCDTIVLDIGFFFDGSDAGSGATISHLKFEGPAFPVFSRGADDVTVTQCTMVDPIQGVTNWNGNSWEISHNVIADLRSANGGGIGILVGVPQAVQGTVSDNVVSHNQISGTLHVSSCDGGGYCGTGVVLYADFRSGALGPKVVTNTRVTKNKISLVSDNAEVVDVVAIELSDTRDDDDLGPVLHDNTISFNDLRGTEWAISLTPASLEEENTITRNLGTGIGPGTGVRPSVFGPFESEGE